MFHRKIAVKILNPYSINIEIRLELGMLYLDRQTATQNAGESLIDKFKADIQGLRIYLLSTVISSILLKNIKALTAIVVICVKFQKIRI